MNSIDPSAASLPRSSSYARIHNRLPQRSIPKNRTGIFVENNVYSSPYHAIPPLARPRGVPGPSYRSGRPAAQKQVVQNIRASQEWRGGFFPQPVKRNRGKRIQARIDHRPSPHLLQGTPDYRDLTRRSARNYVAASNNGITHLEDLKSESVSTLSITADCDIDDMKGITGLEEVYKKIVKEEVWNHLSSRHEKGRLKSDKKQPPLLIRSFRNPQNPHLVVQYSDVRQAGKDHVSRPPVPAPYFYNSRNLLKAADHGGSRVHLSRLIGTQSSDHILAAPGAGALTKSALGFNRGNNPPSGVEGLPPPTMTPRGKLIESDERIGMMERFRVPSTTPATSHPDLQKALNEETDNVNHVVIPDYHDNESVEDQHSIVKSAESTDRASSILSSITISLETDEGISKIIDLEEEEERNKKDVLEYHAVQKALQGNTEDEKVENQEKEELNIKGTSDQAPVELDQLLHEHSELVNQIQELEKLTCSDDEAD